MISAALLLRPQGVEAPATLELIAVNLGDGTLTYGLAYEVERWDGKRWQKTDIAPDIFPQIALIVGPHELGRPQSVEIPADIETSFYRVTKSITEDTTGTALKLHALFQVC